MKLISWAIGILGIWVILNAIVIMPWMGWQTIACIVLGLGMGVLAVMAAVIPRFNNVKLLAWAISLFGYQLIFVGTHDMTWISIFAGALIAVLAAVGALIQKPGHQLRAGTS